MDLIVLSHLKFIDFMEDKFGIRNDVNGLACFKVTICKGDQTVDVVCPWSSDFLFNQVVNALNAGDTCIIDVTYLSSGVNIK